MMFQNPFSYVAGLRMDPNMQVPDEVNFDRNQELQTTKRAPKKLVLGILSIPAILIVTALVVVEVTVEPPELADKTVEVTEGF